MLKKNRQQRRAALRSWRGDMSPQGRMVRIDRAQEFGEHTRALTAFYGVKK